jgi:hypothetical protein
MTRNEDMCRQTTSSVWAAQASELLNNGGFETGTLARWTVTKKSVVSRAPYLLVEGPLQKYEG